MKSRSLSPNNLHSVRKRFCSVSSRHQWKRDPGFWTSLMPRMRHGLVRMRNARAIRVSRPMPEVSARVGAMPPNPSLEPTRNGMALGPRSALAHHAPRGPSTMPLRAGQLER